MKHKGMSSNIIHALAALWLTAVGMLTLAGFDSTSGDAMSRTITLAEANIKVDEYAENARQAIAPNLEFRVQEKQTDAPCSNSDGSPAQDRRDSSLSYELQGISADQIPGYFEALRTWWVAHGFTITDENPGNRFLRGEKKDDGFSMAMQSNNLGQVYLTVNSPCVWRNGTPEP